MDWCSTCQDFVVYLWDGSLWQPSLGFSGQWHLTCKASGASFVCCKGVASVFLLRRILTLQWRLTLKWALSFRKAMQFVYITVVHSQYYLLGCTKWLPGGKCWIQWHGCSLVCLLAEVLGNSVGLTNIVLSYVGCPDNDAPSSVDCCLGLNFVSARGIAFSRTVSFCACGIILILGWLVILSGGGNLSHGVFYPYNNIITRKPVGLKLSRSNFFPIFKTMYQ